MISRGPASWMAAACAAACLAAGTASAGPRIVNGLGTQDFPTTGALLYSGSTGAAINAANADIQCSGTLIGCQTFLTAAHCIADDLAASHYWVYLQHGGIATVSSVIHHPNYVADVSGRDVAIVKLSAPVTGIDPTTLNTTHDLDAIGVGLAGTIAGFGRTGGGSDYGVKRYGAVVTASCNPADTGGEGDDKLVCWNYEAPVGAPGTDSNTCNGDSGGPLFMNFSGNTEITGVTSAGTSTNCLPTDHSWDASVYYNRAWILGQLGADSTAACGLIPAVGEPTVTVYQNSGTLDSSNTSDSFSVNIAGSPALVRFTLNGLDSGVDPDFFVKQGSGASASSYTCKADTASSFGSCTFDNPAAGTWSVFVQRGGTGSGLYQVTTTVFDVDPPVCGNGMVEGTEECDGLNLGSCATGPCVACACPAPVCSNNIVESGEECDGTSDAACAGQCQVDCSCPRVCSSGDLYGLAFVADARRFTYRTRLYDESSTYLNLDPTAAPFTLAISDGTDSVDLAIPAADVGWIKADNVHRKYRWKGDGSVDGLRQITLAYKPNAATPYWALTVRGREVTGAGSLDVGLPLDFDLGFDGTCNLETW